MPWVPVNDVREVLEKLDLFKYHLVPGKCGDCGVKPGQIHHPNCDVQRCSNCGGQRLSCGCPSRLHDPRFARWTGFWPGTLECIALGMLVKWEKDPNRPVPADMLPMDVGPDLNRFATEGWEKFFFVKPKADAAKVWRRQA